MPLTAFQKEVLGLLASHRNPESHVAGGTVLNRTPDSPRYSVDIDIFHDIADSVLNSAEVDVALLRAHGLTADWLIRQTFLQRAQISSGDQHLKLDWCYDSAFRFFPVQPDPELGYCLHRADLATNKMLALAGRSEVRDLLDILYLHQSYLSIGAVCWAASAKDQGFTPWSLLDHASRNMKYRQEDLEREHLTQPVRLTELKESWLKASGQAEEWFGRLPAADVGCLYLNDDGTPFTPNPADPHFAKLRRHFGTVRGAWPKPVLP
jgi:nucleotidyltransferase AbiEii toxin of type IV toxin-antitoxin system